jgi:beta-aspartyl-dipeptidase (metallo-type)
LAIFPEDQMTEPDSPFLLIEGGHVFAPEELGARSILVCYDKIVSIAPDHSSMVQGLGNVRRIDATGKLVVPGFIDGHVHFLGAGDYDAPLGRVPELHLSMLTSGGVTTAASLLGLDMDSKNLHALLVKAIELERQGLSTYIYVGSFKIPSPYLTSSVRSDIQLIDRVVGVKVSMSEDCYPNLSLPDFAQLAGEVRLAAGMTGKTAVIHIHVGRNETRLQPVFDLLKVVNIPITQIIPTHVNRRKPDTLSHAFEFVRRGGTVDLSSNLSIRSGSLSGMNPDEAVQHALDERLPLSQFTLSSDANTSMPTLNHDCCPVGLHNAHPTILHRELLQIIRTNNLTLPQALPLVTTNVARVLGIGRRKGSLHASKDADIVLLRSDDLAVDTVIAKGRIMVSGGEPVVTGPWEVPTSFIWEGQFRT